MRTVCVGCLAVVALQLGAAEGLPLRVIPRPAQTQLSEGRLLLKGDVTVSCNDPWIADHLATQLSALTGVKLRTVKTAGTIQLVEGDAGAGPESYQLEVHADGVLVRAPSSKGLLYGAITIRQLAVRTRNGWALSAGTISDQPRFRWRGFMNDCSRTFIPVEELKRYIDAMAFYKLNVFHLHLTDDQGWRVEIKKYPKLTELGAAFDPMYKEPAEFSGFYTQQQLKELVAYAARRNVEIVPEIDLPGHSWPALLAYPELSVSRDPQPRRIFPWHLQRKEVGGFIPDSLDPTDEQVYRFIGDVLDELGAIFPSKYFHMGGDEVKLSIWKKSPRLQAFIKKHDLKDEHGLQAYFVRRVNKLVRARGKTLIGWDEIMYGGLPEGAAVMAWRKPTEIVKAVDAGAHTVITTNQAFYLDYWPIRVRDPSARGFGGVNTVREMYEYDPTPSLSAEQRRLILGMQGTMWTHVARKTDDINRMVFPRLIAVAENAWSGPQQNGFADFERRLKTHFAELDRMGLTYYADLTAGSWEPAMIREEKTPLTWELSSQISQDGRYEATMQYSQGKHGLYLHKAELLREGKVISTDEHEGFAGGRPKDNTYRLNVKDHVDGARYVLRVTISGGGGTDSHGTVAWRRVVD